MEMKRTEYPRPQFYRESWKNLNGEWSFAFDDENKGLKEKWFLKEAEYSQKIEVPFVYQSELSGINDQSQHDIIWYQKLFTLPEEMKDKRIILHFGAVDYSSEVYVNGQKVGEHIGGHTSFEFEITNQLGEGEQCLSVRVTDFMQDETIPRGKQFWLEKPESIWYTNTTGIWQTVWIEPVEESYIKKSYFTPNIDNGTLALSVEFDGNIKNKVLSYVVEYKGEKIAEDTVGLFENRLDRKVQIYQQHIFRTGFHHDGWNWTPENPNLFDITLSLKEDEKTLDIVQSYFGMRKIHTENGMVYLNNKPYYQKLVLDQGYWPESLMTAPTDEALKKDIELAVEMGFNGCRKHQKVEDPRFLYWADKLGFLVWGECASAAYYSEQAAARLTVEWIEIIERDYNHPSIVTWVPLNESWGVQDISLNRQQQHHSQALYHLVHSLDTTRLVISNDGWEMTETDICAIHNYAHGAADEQLKAIQFKEDLALSLIHI